MSCSCPGREAWNALTGRCSRCGQPYRPRSLGMQVYQATDGHHDRASSIVVGTEVVVVGGAYDGAVGTVELVGIDRRYAVRVGEVCAIVDAVKVR